MELLIFFLVCVLFMFIPGTVVAGLFWFAVIDHNNWIHVAANAILTVIVIYYDICMLKKRKEKIKEET